MTRAACLCALLCALALCGARAARPVALNGGRHLLATCFQEQGVDYPGGDMPGKGATATSAQACCDRCAATFGCKVWTFNTSTRMCWLKSQALKRQANVSVAISGTPGTRPAIGERDACRSAAHRPRLACSMPLPRLLRFPPADRRPPAAPRCTTLTPTPPPALPCPALHADCSSCGKATHAEASQALAAAGIGLWSSGGCSNRNVGTCTSLDTVNRATVQGAIKLAKAAGLALTVTGGTETGHASGTYSHWNGYKLDFGLPFNPKLGAVITSRYRYIGTRSDGAKQYQNDATGDVYALEGDHWDAYYPVPSACSQCAF